MIIDWMKMTRQFSLAAASINPAPTAETSIPCGVRAGMNPAPTVGRIIADTIK